MRLRQAGAVSAASGCECVVSSLMGMDRHARALSHSPWAWTVARTSCQSALILCIDKARIHV